jgi:glycosyltransferase involved in cell wall biosynthesis
MIGDISVIIPAFNSSYLSEALASVFSQTLPPREILIVDGSPEITLPQITDCHERVRYFSQSPNGVSAARNFGIEKAKGEFVALLDADDIWLPTKLETQLSLLQDNPEVGFAFSTVWNLIDDTKPCAITKGPFYPEALCKWMADNNEHQGAVRGWVYDLLLEVNCVATSSLIIRRDVFEKTGYFDESLRNAEDYEMELRLAKKYPAFFISESTSRYRVHDSGLSGAWAFRSDLFHRTNLSALEKHYRLFPSLSAKKAIAQTCASYALHLLSIGEFQLAARHSWRSLGLYPSVRALKYYAEANCPGGYRFLSSMLGNAQRHAIRR